MGLNGNVTLAHGVLLRHPLTMALMIDQKLV